MKVDLDRCKGCGICEEICPLGVIRLKEKKAFIEDGCVECKTCMKMCPQNALILSIIDRRPQCSSCPILCRIPEGGFGACMRYYNKDGKIVRKERLHTYEEVESIVKSGHDPSIERPLITGIGSGTTYPDFIPSPFIVKGVREGIDIVTVVTEAPLSYSGLKVKIDSDLYLGTEGKRVYVKRKGRRTIGHLCTEEYGSKMLSLGGVNILTSKDGQFAARVIYELLRGKRVEIEIEDGAKVEFALGEAPVINGIIEEKMRVGCGSATSGLFAPYMFNAADEVIVLDGHITALFSEHPAGKYLKKKRSCIQIKGQKSTDGRYFLEKGDGWGGTNIHNPLDVIKEIDRDKAYEGMTLLITETTGQKVAFFRMVNGEFVEERLTQEAAQFINVLKDSCQPSKTSGIFAAGVGGSARAGVTKNPIKLTRAVHEGKVKVTIGGAEPFIFPGGGINFLVDVSKIRYGSIYLSPTPSFVLPVEYTMTYETFKAIGGHIDAIRPLEEVLKESKGDG
ncbi:MAG: 4Fe-4S dicluster domain-containing protein [Syntrophorhabdaceae bacterium]|nr:4Fe-4S dicluster domain-containing protein [Syntrophorhabdaceae bacterium]